MKIEEHISELLFEHDCVIVPDFGGFLCNYASANIDPVKHLFEPPSKRILFNKGLTRNDGLLANHISGKLKLSYTEAVDSITKEVKRYKEELEKDKRLTLDSIGLLYTDDKGSLLFQQDNKLNYLADSFGLSTFYHLPVEQAKAEDQAKVIPIYNERKKVRAYAAAAVITALVGSAFYFTFFEKQTNLRLSSFDFLSKKEASQYAFSPSLYKDLPKPIEIDKTAVAKMAVPTSTSFSVIVGSFSVKEHAENLIQQYSKKNVHLSIVGRNPQGLYMVGIANLTSHDAAASERDIFRSKFSKDAWVKSN
jgi:hypothetical protein